LDRRLLKVSRLVVAAAAASGAASVAQPRRSLGLAAAAPCPAVAPCRAPVVVALRRPPVVVAAPVR